MEENYIIVLDHCARAVGIGFGSSLERQVCTVYVVCYQRQEGIYVQFV